MWSYESLNSVMEGIDQAAIVADRDGTIVWSNEAADELFGVALVGTVVNERVPERFRGIHREHRRDFLKDPHERRMGVISEAMGEDKARALPALNAAGEEMLLNIGLVPISEEDGLTGVVFARADD